MGQGQSTLHCALHYARQPVYQTSPAPHPHPHPRCLLAWEAGWLCGPVTPAAPRAGTSEGQQGTSLHTSPISGGQHPQPEPQGSREAPREIRQQQELAQATGHTILLPAHST